MFTNSEKIEIYLMGGLGNVLYQLNHGDYLTSKGFEVIYCDYFLDKNFFTWISGWSIHGTKGDLLSLGIYDIYKFKTRSFVSIFSLLLSKFFKINFLGALFTQHHYSTLKSVHVLCGYFHLNTPISSKLCNLIRKKKKSSVYKAIIHYRGGDYNESIYPCIDRYYSKVIDQISPLSFNVVTNDRKSVPDFILKSDGFAGFTDSCTSLDDFLIMVNSEILICANSTFSWWAAEFSDAIVYEPDPYFTHLIWEPISKINRNKIHYDA